MKNNVGFIKNRMSSTASQVQSVVPVQQVLDEAERLYQRHDIEEVLHVLSIAEKDYRKVHTYSYRRHSLFCSDGRGRKRKDCFKKNSRLSHSG